MNPNDTVAQESRGEVVSTYLSARDAKLLRERASAADRSLAAEIRRMLRPALNDARPDGDPGAVTDSGVEAARHECSG